jgi:quercetin dioxygenase-like cupin family protein
MRIIDTEKLQWHTGPGHREGGIFLRDVLTGQEGAPGNYWLSLVRVEDAYDTPRHEHNFEQVRVMLEGAFNFGDQDQVEGTIGYFSEGTSYEQHARGKSLTLLLQCEGGSGSRYLSQSEMRRAVNELRARGGDFANGMYTGPDPLGDECVVKDSVEALWEHMAGIRARYAPSRYERPVIMRPDAFNYRPMPDVPGVSEKLLGVFNERRLELLIWKLEPGAVHQYRGREAGHALLFVMKGKAECNDAPLGHRFAAEVTTEDEVTLVGGEDGAEILVFGMPK